MTRTSEPAGAVSVPDRHHRQAVRPDDGRDEVRAPAPGGRRRPPVPVRCQTGPARTAACPSARSTSSRERGRHLRAVQLRAAHHLEDRRPDEHLEAHEHAHRVAGQAEVRLALDLPEPLRHARLHRHLVEVHLAAAEERRLHHVALAHRDAARGDERVGLDQVAEDGLLQRVDVVAARCPPGPAARPPRGARRRSCTRSSRGPARTRASPSAGSARRRSTARSPAVADGRAGWGNPAFASSPSSGGPRRLPAGTSTSPAFTSSPDGTDVLSGRRAVEDRRHLATRLRVLDRHDGVGTRGDRRAGRDAHRLAAAHHRVGPASDPGAADDLQLDRRRWGGAGHIGGADGEPVHRR